MKLSITVSQTSKMQIYYYFLFDFQNNIRYNAFLLITFLSIMMILWENNNDIRIKKIFFGWLMTEETPMMTHNKKHILKCICSPLISLPHPSKKGIWYIQPLLHKLSLNQISQCIMPKKVCTGDSSIYKISTFLSIDRWRRWFLVVFTDFADKSWQMMFHVSHE